MPLYKNALVYIIRGKRKRVIGRSFQRFETEEEFKEFYEYSRTRLDEYSNLEIYQVSLRDAFPPKGRPDGNKDMWCPYCAEWSIFRKSDDGYKRCEVCEITTQEFYVKKHNHLYE